MFHSNAWLPLHPDVSEVEIDLINKELWRKFSRLNHEMKVTPDGRFVLFIHNYNYNMRESMSHIHVAKTLLQVTTWWASCKWGSLSSLQLRWVSCPTPAFSLGLLIFHIIPPFFFWRWCSIQTCFKNQLQWSHFNHNSFLSGFLNAYDQHL